MADRSTIRLAEFMAREPRHARALEMALYYITIVRHDRVTLMSSLGDWRPKYTMWCVRNHLPFGMVGKCCNRVLSHSVRRQYVLIPNDFTTPVILSPRGLAAVRWTLDYYKSNPVTEYPEETWRFTKQIMNNHRHDDDNFPARSRGFRSLSYGSLYDMGKREEYIEPKKPHGSDR